MTDYYRLLELPRSATPAEIKAAYKRLAMRYHPDHNQGNPVAEERFKLINEAYHVLADPLKKGRYDRQFEAAHTLPPQPPRDPRRRPHPYGPRTYAPRPPQGQNRGPQTYYKVDRQYFRIQGLAVLTFFIIAGICFGIAHGIEYFNEKQQLEKWMANTRALKQVNGLFNNGHFDEAFDLISDLKYKDPMEFRFAFARDSLVGALGRLADNHIAQGNYAEAVRHLLVLKNYEDPEGSGQNQSLLETLRKIANCQYHLGNYDEALQALKRLHNQEPRNLQLVYQIAMIDEDKLGRHDEALQYFDLGKKLFKNNLTEIYGEAFEMVLNPMDAPDIYYELFIGRARTNISLKRYNEAITDGNWAVYLRRHEPGGYYWRAVAKTHIPSQTGLCSDLGTARQLGHPDAATLQKQYCH